MSETVGTLIVASLETLAELASLGEEIEDEWSYVGDLETAWRERLETVAAQRAGEDASPATERGILTAIEEARRIGDPHRAIDWLSTFPQVVLVALEEPR